MSQFSTEGLDQELVKQATRGGEFGRKDKARYDAYVRAREAKKNPSKPGAPKLTEGEDGIAYAGGTKGFYDEEGPGTVKGKGRTRDQIEARKSKIQARKFSENPIDQTVTGSSDNVPGNGQSVNQTNGISSNVTGNDNTVINEQDNSIRNYGGDNRSFTYNGNGSSSDSPVSAATMSGFYDVDDSPAAQAKFNDMYTTMNRDNQKRYAGEGMKMFAKYGNLDAREYTNQSMDNQLGRSIQYSYDRSDRQTGHVFGDIWNDNYITEEWKMPSAPSKIESNAEDIAKKAKDDIEDI